MQLKPIRFEPNEKKKDEDDDVKSDTDESAMAKIEQKPAPRQQSTRNQSERRDSLDILADCAASLRTYGNV